MRFSVTAASLLGDNVRLRRVRLINFGTSTPSRFDGLQDDSKSYEGFPLRIEGRTTNRVGGDLPAFNSWMENCIIEQPFSGPGREVTNVVAGGVATTADGVIGTRLHLEPFGCGIRDCYMNFEFINPRPGNAIAIDDPLDLSVSAEVTVKTRYPHRFYPGDYVEITGGGVPELNKRFLVKRIGGTGDPVLAERLFTFDLSPAPSQPSGARVFYSPAETLPASLSLSGSSVTITTTKNHNRFL